MGYRLYREVLDHAPPDITSGELLVWLVIADDAKDGTRIGWIDQAKLQRRTRLSERGIRQALHKLAGRGFELRVQRGTDKTGRPVFAHRGMQLTYKLPKLSQAVDDGVDEPVDNEPQGGTTVPPCVEEGGTIASEGGTTVPPFPSVPSVPSQQRAGSAEEIVQSATDASDTEAAAVVGLIGVEAKQPIRSMVGFIRRLGDDGELAGWLDRVRQDASRETVRRFVAGLADKPACIHGTPGGGELRPDTGEPQCALCRTAWKAVRSA